MTYTYTKTYVCKYHGRNCHCGDCSDNGYCYNVRVTEDKDVFVDMVHGPTSDEAIENAKIMYPNPPVSNIQIVSIVVASMDTYDGVVVKTARYNKRNGQHRYNSFSPNSESRMTAVLDHINNLMDSGHFVSVKVIQDFDIMVTTFEAKG